MFLDLLFTTKSVTKDCIKIDCRRFILSIFYQFHIDNHVASMVYDDL